MCEIAFLTQVCMPPTPMYVIDLAQSVETVDVHDEQIKAVDLTSKFV